MKKTILKNIAIFTLSCFSLSLTNISNANWNDVVQSGDPLTADSWNQLVAQISTMISSITTLTTNVTTINSTINNITDNFSTDGTMTLKYGGAVDTISNNTSLSDGTASIPNSTAVKTYVDTKFSAAPVDSNVVHKTGDETISGIKTFGSDTVTNKISFQTNTNSNFSESNGINAKIGGTTGTYGYRIQKSDGSNIMVISGNQAVTLNYTTNAASRGFTVASAYSFDNALTHAVGGHRLFMTWGDLGSATFQTSGTDGGWGMVFGSWGRRYIEMINSAVLLGDANTYTQVNGGLGIGTNRGGNLANTTSIAIGDTDTGFKQGGDGILLTYTNDTLVRKDTSSLTNQYVKFNINGANNFQYTDGNQSDGKILTSDANGNARWDNNPGGLSQTRGFSILANTTSNTPYSFSFSQLSQIKKVTFFLYMSSSINGFRGFLSKGEFFTQTSFCNGIKAPERSYDNPLGQESNSFLVNYVGGGYSGVRIDCSSVSVSGNTVNFNLATTASASPYSFTILIEAN